MAWTTLPGMSRRAVAGIAVLLLAVAGLAGGCGGGGAKSSSSSSSSGGGGAQAGALSAEEIKQGNCADARYVGRQITFERPLPRIDTTLVQFSLRLC